MTMWCMSEIVTLQLHILGKIGSSPLSICDRVPLHYFDTTSLGRAYLNEVVSIQGRAHIADLGSSPLILHSHYENVRIVRSA